MLQPLDACRSMLVSNSSDGGAGALNAESLAEEPPLTPVLSNWGRKVENQSDKSLPNILSPACDEAIRKPALQRGVDGMEAGLPLSRSLHNFPDLIFSGNHSQTYGGEVSDQAVNFNMKRREQSPEISVDNRSLDDSSTCHCCNWGGHNCFPAPMTMNREPEAQPPGNSSDDCCGDCGDCGDCGGCVIM